MNQSAKEESNKEIKDSQFQDNFSSNNILCCIGHITKDKIVTPESTIYMSGGTSFYFSYAMNQLPQRVKFSLVTAMNPNEKEPVEKMRQAGIDVTLFPSHHTVFFENIYGDNPDDRTQRVLAKADPFTVGQLQNFNAKIYHLGSLLRDDFPLSIVKYLAQKGRISIDAQGYLREVRGKDVYPIDWKEKKEVLQYTYYLKVNETEMETITGKKDPKEAALELHQWGVHEVCITLGSLGSIIYVNGQFYQIPAYPPHKFVDATGCGDTYSAGYLYCRMQGKSPAEAGRYAAAMCTLKLEHNGPFNGTEQDIKDILEGNSVR
jgi:sugar/nucleoside kinase (ribokinase family)